MNIGSPLPAAWWHPLLTSRGRRKYISISKFRREASENSGRSGVRAPFWPRKHRRVVRNRNSGSLGAPRAFGWSECACLALLGPPEMPLGLAAEPQMRAKVPLGPDPELPDAPKCCSGLLRSRLCTQRSCLGSLQSCQIAPKACPSQFRSHMTSKKLSESPGIRHALEKCCSKSFCGSAARKPLFECAARNYYSKSHVSVTPYSH